MPTIQDVARLAGVSVATVSYVLNGGPRPVAPETREKVLRAIEALDYQPNASARQLARRRADCLGVLVAGLSDTNFSTPYFLEYIRGISYAAEAHGYNVMLFSNHRQATGRSLARSITRSGMVDGLLCLGSSVPDEFILNLSQRGFPVVLMARRIEGHPIPYVQQDYYQGTYEATRYALSRGYRRIGFLGQHLHFSYGVDRFQAYRQALADGGIPYDPALVQIPETPRDDPSLDEVRHLLEAGAEVLLTDREVAVLTHLWELGKRLADDIALIGLDESEGASLPDVSLTTFRPPKFEIGRLAVELLIQIIQGNPPEPPQIVLPMQFIERASCPPRFGGG
ncbi:MAG: LacI family DNA-binding transcriptional regulator [Anaerolineae bacterium]